MFQAGRSGLSSDGAAYYAALHPPTLFFLLVINTVNAFQIFTQVKLMTKGGPGGSTSVMAYSIYESAFVSTRWGYACAQSIVFFVILLIISIIQFKAEKKGVFYQ